MSSKPKKNSSSKKNDTKSSTKKNTLSSKASKGKATKKEEQIPTITIETKPPKFPLPPQPKNFKQLEYKVDENKLYLVDYNNNTFECNLYGNALPTFNDKISGKATYTTRNTLLNNKQQFSFEYNQLYHPITQNFEGYSPYPRPLSLPFINECSNPTLFIKQLSKENRFTTSKNKNIIKLKLPSKDKQFKLTYLTSSIHLNEQDTKKYLLKLIDNYINDLIKENPYYEERVMKSPNVKALLRFQKILKLNMDANVVNGKSIQPAPKEYKETFDIINTVRRRNVLTRPNSSKKINENVYKVMYSIRTVPKHYYQTLTETVSRNTTLSPTKSTLETKSRVDTKMGYEDNKTIRSIKLDNVTTYTKTTGFGLTTVNRFCKGNDDTQKYFEDLNNKENLSFLSVEEIPEDNNANKKVVKRNEQFVNGWVNSSSKGVTKDFYKTSTTLIKPSGAQYLKEITRLQKVNPIPFKKEESKELADLQMIQKKKQSRQIYEKIKIKEQ